MSPIIREHQGRTELVLEVHAGFPSRSCGIYPFSRSQIHLESDKNDAVVNPEILNIKRIPPENLFKKYQCHPPHRDFIFIHLEWGLAFGIVQ